MAWYCFTFSWLKFLVSINFATITLKLLSSFVSYPEYPGFIDGMRKTSVLLQSYLIEQDQSTVSVEVTKLTTYIEKSLTVNVKVSVSKKLIIAI